MSRALRALTLCCCGRAARAVLYRPLVAMARRRARRSPGRFASGRMWQQQGKKEEARQMLAEIYNWFTEGFDTKDLQEAKALLEELEEEP
jgi:hypothetical protein